MKKNILILFILIIILISGSFFFYNLKPKIILFGDKNITITVNSNFQEPGYKTIVGNKDITEYTTINSNLNTNEIGNYIINYKIKYNNKTFIKKRKVKVIDQNPPVISILGEGILEMCPDETYQETGYIALDKYDGNITDKVNVIQTEDKILYFVKNSLGNKYMTTRKIVKKDSTKPKIELYGKQLITMYLGTNYNELGFKAIDNCDGDLTTNVIVSNNLNINKKGSYKITYSVKDKSGNECVIDRYIDILSEPKSNEKMIYFTFDDGPSSTTPKILDVLKKENIKATFFVINTNNKYNRIIKRAFDEGHTIGLHSYSHKYKDIYSSTQTYFNDLDLINEKVEKITGVKSNIIRFPGGSSNAIAKKGIMNTLSKSTKNAGYIYFDWNIASSDTSNISSKRIYNKVVNQLKRFNYNTNIILMHDFSNNNKTVKALEDIIRYGKENGYRFEKITEWTPKIQHKIKR